MARSIDVLLAEMRAGDRDALDELIPHVYPELRKIAARHMAHERPGHTLSPTALVHEAYVKVAADHASSFADRAHFLAAASVAMRRILVSRARARLASKRGGTRRRVSLVTEELDGIPAAAEQLLAIDEALSRLEALDARQGQVVTLRYYGGLTDDEIAEAMGVSAPTIRRAWRLARAWLVKELVG